MRAGTRARPGARAWARTSTGPVPDGGATSTGPRVPYDLTAYAGISFWAMAMPGNSTMVRAKMVMRVSTQIEDGGACDESILGLDKCGDEWGEAFSLPATEAGRR